VDALSPRTYVDKALIELPADLGRSLGSPFPNLEKAPLHDQTIVPRILPYGIYLSLPLVVSVMSRARTTYVAHQRLGAHNQGSRPEFGTEGLLRRSNESLSAFKVFRAPCLAHDSGELKCKLFRRCLTYKCDDLDRFAETEASVCVTMVDLPHVVAQDAPGVFFVFGKQELGPISLVRPEESID
jgi:hypothetical protein